jgi:hypothetical protein
MSLDDTKVAQLLELSYSGKPKVCAYWAVTWDANDTSQTRYYSDAKYNEMLPFHGIGFDIEPRILGNAIRDTEFEINPDLRTETISLVFDDIDKDVTDHFQAYGSGVRCELFFYYPDVDLTFSAWFGQLQAPPVYGHKVLQTTVTNGFRSREQLIPKRMRPRECTANFGGMLPSEFALASNGCTYDRHLGGTTGNFITGSTPYTACPRISTTDCHARMPFTVNGDYFLGFSTDASGVVTDPRSGYVAVTKGNASILKTPIRVIAGTKYVRALPLLLWRREANASTPDHGFVRGIFEVGEGPVKQIYNVKVIEKLIEQINLEIRTGSIFQGRTNYASNVSNFSGTAHFAAAYGWVNPLDISAPQLQAECNVIGFRKVAIWNDTAPGNGIEGVYYTGSNFTAEIGRRIDSTINYPLLQTTPPMEDLDSAQGFSIRWEGEFETRYTESYTFTVTKDNGAKLWIDDVLVIDEWASPAGTYSSASIPLTANTRYNVKLEYTQEAVAGTGNTWGIQLFWQSTSEPYTAVPFTQLFHAGSSGFSRQWTDDRVWWLMELFTNQRFGMSYPIARFTIDDWITTANWGRQSVSFTKTFDDGEEHVYSGRRTTFDAVLEGRPVAEQIEDICRSGAISVPFQHEGEFTIANFGIADTTPGTPLSIAAESIGASSVVLTWTAAEETIADRVFSDTGEARNILWGEGQPSIYLEQVPDDRIVNEIVLTFEEANNYDVERPITVDDPDQKLKAGRILGEDNLQSVPKRFAAFGIRNEQEAVRLGYRLLYFGEFDEGGTKNNLRATFTTPFEQVIGLKRYTIIKIVSRLLEGFNTPAGDEFEFFRVLRMKKIGNGLVEVVAQAYNHLAYTAFETIQAVVGGPNPGDPPPSPLPDPPDPPDPLPDPCEQTFASPPTYDAANGKLNVPVPPC